MGYLLKYKVINWRSYLDGNVTSETSCIDDELKIKDGVFMVNGFEEALMILKDQETSKTERYVLSACPKNFGNTGTLLTFST